MMRDHYCQGLVQYLEMLGRHKQGICRLKPEGVRILRQQLREQYKWHQPESRRIVNNWRPGYLP